MEVLKKVLNIIIDIFIVLVVIVSATIAVVSITARDSGVANLFGYVPFSVQSNSMSPVFEAGDMIVGKLVEEEDRVFENFEVGDIVTYWASTTDENGLLVEFLNTHRIVDVQDRAGIDTFITKGDNNDKEDENFVTPEAIVSVWSRDGKDDGFMIKKLGSVLDFLRKPSGFFIAVVIPMIIFFIYELVRFITNFMSYNRQKAKEAALEAAKEMMGDSSSDSSGLSEEQKAQAILEYLEKQKAEKGEAQDPKPEPVPEEAVEATEPEDSAEESTADEEAAEALEEAQEAPEASEEAEASESEASPEALEATQESEETEETEQPDPEEDTEAVPAPEQEETVSEDSED